LQQARDKVPTPEPGPKSLLQRAPTKFAAYDVTSPERLWPALKPKEAWAGSLPSTGDDKRKPSHSPVPPHVIVKRERCSRCTRQEMWAAYDVFRSMDKRGVRQISRHDYLQTMSNYPTLDKLKVLKRSGLEGRFRMNAKEVSLEEFLWLMWPQATDEDMETMLHWAKLRDAQELVRAGNFVGEIDDLRQV
jgi:hypothetical protein